MRSWICRCKHCGKEYSYQASGEGCNNKLNNEEYCPECMKAILNALEKIPVRFEHRWHECERPDDKIIERLKELKKEDDEKIAKENEEFRQEQLNNPHSLFNHNFDGLDEPLTLPRFQKFEYFPDDIKTAAEFCYDWVRYSVSSPTDDLFDENARWMKVEEYDLVDKKFTGRRWYDKTRESYEPITVRHWMKIKPEDVEVRPLSPPCGNLLFMDILSHGEKKDESETTSEDATILDASSLIDEWRKRRLKNFWNISEDAFSRH